MIAGTGLRATRLFDAWTSFPEAQQSIDHLLCEDTLPLARGEGLHREMALKSRMDGFDKDNSLAKMVARGLTATEATAKQHAIPSRDKLSRLRQKLLESVFLPGEDEVLWGSDGTLNGIDILAFVESQRRDEVEGIAQALKIETTHDFDVAQLFGHEAADKVDYIMTLNREAKHLYRVAYIGIRICVCSVHCHLRRPHTANWLEDHHPPT